MADEQDNHSPAYPSNTTVSYKDSFMFGVVAAGIVLISTIIFTAAWSSLRAMALVGLYTVVTFLVVFSVTALLNWISSRRGDQDQKSFPVLK
ncbi:hypothetical protein [Brevibacterium otitidis]|uniref:Uncharacterized protein n=1 Tax=Brevibacterium otitidis TaxID=53364 RepID=A0ABV5X3I1_9MICO|nr:hypothetical protein GCM10023233_33790 [Brevibacterium otitidis]